MKKCLKVALIVLFAVVLPAVFICTPVWVYNNVGAGYAPFQGDWISFWGGYVGSALGVLATILAFGYTYLQNKEQHKITQDQLGEQLRLQVLPLISLSRLIEDTNKESHIYVDLSEVDMKGITVFNYKYEEDKAYVDAISKDKDNYLIDGVGYKNIGLGPASQLELCHDNEAIYVVESLMTNERGNEYLYFIFNNNQQGLMAFKWRFRDVGGRMYEQEFILAFNEQDSERLSHDPPVK